MPLPVLVRPEFWDDLRQAVVEYEEKQPGLGKRLGVSTINHLDSLPRFPESRRIVSGSLRRELIRPFDF